MCINTHMLALYFYHPPEKFFFFSLCKSVLQFFFVVLFSFVLFFRVFFANEVDISNIYKSKTCFVKGSLKVQG